MSESRNNIYGEVQPDTPSLRAAYQYSLEETEDDFEDKDVLKKPEPIKDGEKVAILGGGMSGLYCALLLEKNNVPFHVFEADKEYVGGRVHTHYFNQEEDQYFEAGAMRLPHIDEHKPVFNLINYVNKRVPKEDHVELIKYHMTDKDGNLVYVNGQRRASGKKEGEFMNVNYAKKHPQELGFGDFKTSASDMLDKVLSYHFIDKLSKKSTFNEGFKHLMEYDDHTLRSFLRKVEMWSFEKINYVETMTGQSNSFDISLTENVMDSIDFNAKKWSTIKGGMSRLPFACKKMIGDDNITMGAKVYKIENTEDGKVKIYHSKSEEPEVFDKVISTLPPGIFRTLERPRFMIRKEQALRLFGTFNLYKMGIRFKSRFWENNKKYPTKGGQSITDLPSRWIVYPSNGIGSKKAGVLLVYNWATDANANLPKSFDEQKAQALRDLSVLYTKEVVESQFIEAKSVNWFAEPQQGLPAFFPGQFRHLYKPARKPEGNFYFAGVHLSVQHWWIVGALDSALYACSKLLNKELRPLGIGTKTHNFKYKRVNLRKRKAEPEAETTRKK